MLIFSIVDIRQSITTPSVDCPDDCWLLMPEAWSGGSWVQGRCSGNVSLLSVDIPLMFASRTRLTRFVHLRRLTRTPFVAVCFPSTSQLLEPTVPKPSKHIVYLKNDLPIGDVTGVLNNQTVTGRGEVLG